MCIRESLSAARSAAYMTLILSQMIHVFECKLDCGASLSALHLLKNHTLVFACLLSVAVTIAVVYFPPLQAIFQTTAVKGDQLLIALGASLLSPLVGLTERLFEGAHANAQTSRQH